MQVVNDFQQLLADHAPAMAEIADDLRAMVDEQLASQGAAGGTPWAPLAPAALRRKRGPGILYETGALFSSLREPGASGHIEEIDASSLLFGSALPYAIFHQTGTGEDFGQLQPPARGARRGSTRGRGRGFPMRPLMVVSEARSQRWVEIVRAGIEERARLLGPEELGGMTG